MKFKKSLSIIISLMSLSSSTYAKNINKNNLICEKNSEKNIKKKHWLLKPWKELNKTEKKKAAVFIPVVGVGVGVPASYALCHFLIRPVLESHFEKKDRELFGTNTFEEPGNLENFKKEIYELLDYKIKNSNDRFEIKTILTTYFDPIYKTAVLIYGVDNLEKFPILDEVMRIAWNMILVAKKLKRNPDALVRPNLVKFDYRHIFSIYLFLCKTNYDKFQKFCIKHKEVLENDVHYNFKISNLNDLFDLKTKSKGDNRFSFHFCARTDEKYKTKNFSLTLYFNGNEFCYFQIYENENSELQIPNSGSNAYLFELSTKK